MHSSLLHAPQDMKYFILVDDLHFVPVRCTSMDSRLHMNLHWPSLLLTSWQ